MSNKFEFKEFSSESLVETLKKSHFVDKQIQKAVVNRLSEVIDSNDVAAEHKEAESVNEQVKANQGIYSDSELQKIKDEAFLNGKNQGIQEAKIEYESKLSVIESDNSSINNLITKIGELGPSKEPSKDYINLTYEIIKNFSERIYVDLPTNSEKIITDLVSKLFAESYNAGKVVVKVNERIKDKVEKTLKNDKNFDKIDNIEIIVSPELPEGDCVVEYKDTKLVFDKALVKSEIDEIMNQFKQD